MGNDDAAVRERQHLVVVVAQSLHLAIAPVLIRQLGKRVLSHYVSHLPWIESLLCNMFLELHHLKVKLHLHFLGRYTSFFQSYQLKLVLYLLNRFLCFCLSAPFVMLIKGSG